MLTNYTEAQNAANTAIGASGSAVRENERYMESLEAKVNGLKAAFQEIVLGDGGISKFIGSILDATTALLKFLDSWDIGKFVSIVAIFGVGGKLVQGFGKLLGLIGEGTKAIGLLKGAFTGLAAAEGTAAVAAGALTTSLAPFLIGGALIGGLAVVIGKLTDTERATQKAKENIDEAKSSLEKTKNEISSVRDEYNKLSSKDDLNKLEKERLEYLEQQLTVLQKQKKEKEGQVVAATEGGFEFKELYKTSTGKETTKTTRGLEGMEKQLNKTKQALDNYTKAYDPARQSVQEYNQEIKEGVEALDSIIDIYYDTANTLGELSEQQQDIVERTIEQKLQYAELTDTTADLTEAQLHYAAQTGDLINENGVLSQSLQDSILHFYGVAEGTDQAKSLLAAYRAEAVFVSNASMSPVLNMDRNTLLKVAEAAGVAASKVIQLQNLLGRLKQLNQQAKSLSYTDNRAAAYKHNVLLPQIESLQAEIQSGITSNIDSFLNSTGISTGGTPKVTGTSTGGGGSGGSGKKSKTKKTPDYSKGEATLEKYMRKQVALYQRGEISASKYYDRVYKKAKKLRKQHKISADDFKKYTLEAYKDVFDELEYDYEHGTISAKKYHDQVTKFAKKARKAGKISYAEYRDYIEKADDALNKSLIKNAEKTLNTLLENRRKNVIGIKKYINSAIKEINKLKKAGAYTSAEAKEEITNVYKNVFDEMEHDYERGWTSAKTYYEKIQTYAKEAYTKGYISFEEYREKVSSGLDALVEDTRKAYEKIADELDVEVQAMERYAQSQQDRIDKEIDALNEKRDAIEKANDEQERAIELEKLQQQLAEAKARKVRVYKEGQGFVFTEDIDAVSEAQAEILARQKQDAVDAQYEAIDKEIEALEKERDLWGEALSTYQQYQEDYELAQKLGMEYEKWIQEQRLQNLDDFIKAYDEKLKSQVDVQTNIDMLDKVDAWNARNLDQASNAKYMGYDMYGGVHYSNESQKALDNIIAQYNSGQKKYAGGITSVPYSQFASINERGYEMVVSPSANSAYLGKGAGVIPHTLTQNLMDIGRYDLRGLKNLFGSKGQEQTIIQQFDSIVLPNVTDFEGFVKEMQDLKNFNNLAIQSTYKR